MPNKNLIKMLEQEFTDLADNYEQYFKRVNEDCYSILNVPFYAMTNEMIFSTLRQDPDFIRYFPNPTLDMAKIAFDKDCYFRIKLIENPSEEIQLYLVRNASHYISHIKNPTEKVQIEAVYINPNLIESINNPCETAIQVALDKSSVNFKYLSNPTMLDFEKACNYYLKCAQIFPDTPRILKALALSIITHPKCPTQILWNFEKDFRDKVIQNPNYQSSAEKILHEIRLSHRDEVINK